MIDRDQPSIDDLNLSLQELTDGSEHTPLEDAALRCCKLAIRALEQGSYGVGAVLLDQSNKIISEGHNRVFADGFNSSAHAEMVALDQFERCYPSFGDRGPLTLVVSLEPCPMCLVRTMLAGIGRVVYLVADEDGGMASHIHKLPAAWRNLATLQQRQPAEVSKPLRTLAARIAGHDIQAIRKKVMKVIRDN
ncbi:MAG: nucleoside deaminase [Motiliproteus sp.]|nr:nucleoside deaminase [Motiliproteus sp.]MCW9052068.1 nucleoside deaminase [Motiliproteus sp.]